MRDTAAQTTTKKMLGVGVDIGRRRARAVNLDRDADGKLRLVGAAMRLLPEASGRPVDLRELARRAGAKQGAAHCNLGPARIIVHEVEFPDMDETELSGAVRIEAEQIIPDLDEMVLDYQVIARPRRAERPGGKLKAMIVAAPRQTVDERSALLLNAGLDARSVTPDGLAVANALLALRRRGGAPALALDIGAGGTSVVAVSRRAEIEAPTVRFVRGGAALLKDEETGRERNLLRERWLSEVERTIEFASRRFGQQPEHLLVLGEAAGSAAMLDWIETNLRKPARAWNPLEELAKGADAPDNAWLRENGTHFAVAVGLAVTEGS